MRADAHAGLASSATQAVVRGRNPVPAAAALWGAVVFYPVGVNYLAFFLLGLAFLARGWFDRDGDTSLAARWRRIRTHPLFWPLALFLGWTLVTLLVGPHYPETLSNAFHGVRIVATLAFALALARDELDWALRGFLFGLVVSAAIVALHHSVGLPDPHLWGDLAVWSNLLRVIGNKSISNAVLFAFAGAAALACAFESRGARRYAYLLAYALAIATVVWALPSRTGVVILAAAPPVLAIHRYWGRWRRMLAISLGSLLVVAVLVAGIPAARDRLDQGWTELQAALAGDVSRTSWGLRLNMVRHSAEMVAERPLLGWGIGGWNDQWRRRAPQSIADMNMPHNDFLWMGAQTGVVGMVAVAALVFASVRRIAARRDLVGRLGAVATLTWFVAMSVNSAMRDGVIGLSMLWIVGLVLRMQTEPVAGKGRERADATGLRTPSDTEGVLTLVINLDRSPDRLQRIGQRLQALGIDWERLPAVDGAALDAQGRRALDERGYRRLHGATPKLGELGCYLSHLRAMRAFLASEARFALILEDDAQPSERLPGVVAQLARVGDQWDMVKLSKVHRGTPVSLLALGHGATLDVMLTRCTGSSAYIVNRRAAQTYLDKLLPMTLPYDHVFDRGWQLGIRVRLVSPPPCRHDEEIASTIAPQAAGAPAARTKPPWHLRLPAFGHRALTELRRFGSGLRTVLRSRLQRGL